MSNKKQIKITKEDLVAIYGSDYRLFEEKIIPNCYCGSCHISTIVNYEVYLNDLDDIILKGFCAKCGKPVNRYLETGEVEKFQKMIIKVKGNLEKAGFTKAKNCP